MRAQLTVSLGMSALSGAGASGPQYMDRMGLVRYAVCSTNQFQLKQNTLESNKKNHTRNLYKYHAYLAHCLHRKTQN